MTTPTNHKTLLDTHSVVIDSLETHLLKTLLDSDGCRAHPSDEAGTLDEEDPSDTE